MKRQPVVPGTSSAGSAARVTHELPGDFVGILGPMAEVEHAVRQLVHERRGPVRRYAWDGSSRVLAYHAQDSNPQPHRTGLPSVSIGTRGDITLYRSWPGIAPLYYGRLHNSVAFASAIAPLIRVGIAATEVETVLPGHLVVVRGNSPPRQRHVERFKANRQKLSWASAVTMTRRLVEDAIERVSVGPEAWLLLSGGIDSTILAFLLSRRVKRLNCVTMAVRGALDADSDLVHARRVAMWLDLSLNEVIIDPRDVVNIVPQVIAIAETRRASVVDELAGMFHVARYLRKHRVRHALTGEGPDDIFGLLDFELRFTPRRRLKARMMHNLNVELPFELACQYKLFSTVGVMLTHPYLYRPLVEFALGQPTDFLIGRPRALKILLRSAFRECIPEEFLARRKAITRVATGLKPALESCYTRRPSRYYAIHRTWLSGLEIEAHGEA